MPKSINLMQVTRQLLLASDESMLDIFRITGLNYHWLKSFRAGTFQDPSVNKVQTLYEHLSGKELLPRGESC